MHTHTCHICHTVFETPHKFQKYCCNRCAYIGRKLYTKAGRRLERSEAIAHYGMVYDDPLRPFRRSKYYPLITRIAEFCERRGTNEFVSPDFLAENPDVSNRIAQSLTAVERSTGAVCKTGEKVASPKGNCMVAVWRLCVPVAEMR
jgi:hypothetical protein